MDLDPHSAVGARNRAIVKIVVGLAAAGVVIGLLTGLAGAGAMRAIGFKPDQTPPPASVAPPTGESPETTGTTGSTPASEPTSTPSPDEGGGSGDNKGKDKDKDDQKPSLEASPAQVGAGERISLSGSFPALGEGEVLQVQRREGGSWEDFPVVARTNADGTFETWVVTSRTGRTKFRMKAQDSGRQTPAATVRIG